MFAHLQSANAGPQETSFFQWLEKKITETPEMRYEFDHPGLYARVRITSEAITVGGAPILPHHKQIGRAPVDRTDPVTEGLEKINIWEQTGKDTAELTPEELRAAQNVVIDREEFFDFANTGQRFEKALLSPCSGIDNEFMFYWSSVFTDHVFKGIKEEKRQAFIDFVNPLTRELNEERMSTKKFIRKVAANYSAGLRHVRLHKLAGKLQKIASDSFKETEARLEKRHQLSAEHSHRYRQDYWLMYAPIPSWLANGKDGNVREARMHYCRLVFELSERLEREQFDKMLSHLTVAVTALPENKYKRQNDLERCLTVCLAISYDPESKPNESALKTATELMGEITRAVAKEKREFTEQVEGLPEL
jgi:hypothetical protein